MQSVLSLGAVSVFLVPVSVFSAQGVLVQSGLLVQSVCFSALSVFSAVSVFEGSRLVLVQSVCFSALSVFTESVGSESVCFSWKSVCFSEVSGLVH